MRHSLFILGILAFPFGCSGGIPAGTPGFDTDGDTQLDATSSSDPSSDGTDAENNSHTNSNEGTSADEDTQDNDNSEDDDSGIPSSSDETSTLTDDTTTTETPTNSDTDNDSDTSSDSTDEEEQLPCQNPTDAGTLRFDSIATWKNGATGAYSIMHDDLCGWGLDGIHLYAVDELQKRGLVAGLAAYVEACQERSLWPEVRAAQAMGHEIVNHSYTHSQVTVANSNQEVQKSRDVLNTLLETPVEFFAFPFDAWNDQTITAVALAGHIGARAGSRDDNDGTLNPPINTASPQNDLAIEFDVWPREYSKYMNYTPADLLDIHVHHAIEKKGWAVRELHSVSLEADPDTNGDEGFAPISIETYRKHLDFVARAQRGNHLWVGTPSTVLRYRHARNACKATLTGETLNLDASAKECQDFHTEISSIVSSQIDVPSLEAFQGGIRVPVVKIAEKQFSVNADPTLGPVQLRGCADPGDSVDPMATLPARPTPAASVCDLHSVKGKGGSGKMDDLEREAEDLTLVPNPQQSDGRTGAWSWYPDEAITEIIPDGGSKALRFRSIGNKEWSGIAIAFLNASGAGSCYDASAYQGIEFRIRGSVKSDKNANRIDASLVTAETQSQKFGGDLVGEGAHFFKTIQLTAEWQVVRLRWSELSVPNWGDTTKLTAPAVSKLQAISFSPLEEIADVDIFIDDVVLF